MTATCHNHVELAHGPTRQLNGSDAKAGAHREREHPSALARSGRREIAMHLNRTGGAWLLDAAFTLGVLSCASSVGCSCNSRQPAILCRTLGSDADALVPPDFTGLLRLVGDSGVVEGEYCCKDGVLHGPCKVWNEDGVLVAEGAYLNGKLQGKQTPYYHNGRLDTVENHRRGFLHGTKVKYSFDGGEKYREDYRNGMPWNGRFLETVDGEVVVNTYVKGVIVQSDQFSHSVCPVGAKGPIGRPDEAPRTR